MTGSASLAERVARIQACLDTVQGKLDTVIAHIEWITGIYDHVRQSNRVFRALLPAREGEVSAPDAPILFSIQ